MKTEEFFVRDPREVPFLHGQVQLLLAFAENLTSAVRVAEDDDFGFMALQFLYKQMQHADSLLLLVPRRDACLIARTMIDGYYQLSWASIAPRERGQLWRSFAIIHDWRLMQQRMKEGLPVADADRRRNEAGLKEFGSLHHVTNPKPNSQDPYNRHWRGKVSLAEMASVIGRELYDGPYAELSDWEHWGVSGIGASISREGDHLSVDHLSERITGLALLVAFQCLFHAVEAVDAHLSLKCAQPLQEMSRVFRETIESFKSGSKFLR